MKKDKVVRSPGRVMPEPIPSSVLRTVAGAFASRSPPPQQEPAPGVIASPSSKTGGL